MAADRGMNVFTRLRAADPAQRTLLWNGASLVGTTFVTSVLGFFFWAIAARAFAPPEVGLAAAAISAMTLLGSAGAVGLGTLLIGELARRAGDVRLVALALGVAAVVGLLIGAGFAIAAPGVSVELNFLAADLPTVVLFALGVGLTAASLVLDQALLGVLRGGVQLVRNTIFAVAKLVALGGVVIAAAGATAMMIYATWLAGIVVSFAYALPVLRRAARQPATVAEDAGPAVRREGGRRFARLSAEHHLLNLLLQAPPLLLPLIAAVVLGATETAYFYVAWMLAYFCFSVPIALAMAFYASGARSPAAFGSTLRTSMAASVAIGGVGIVGAFVLADVLLGLFGPAYAGEAPLALRLLVLGVLPLVVKSHYAAIVRIRGRILAGAVLVAAGSAAEVGFAALGAVLGGLPGLCVGWLCGLAVEALLMAPSVLGATLAPARGAES